MAYGLWNGHVTDGVTWPHRCCEAVRSAILATAWLLVHIWIVVVAIETMSSSLTWYRLEAPVNDQFIDCQRCLVRSNSEQCVKRTIFESSKLKR